MVARVFWMVVRAFFGGLWCGYLLTQVKRFHPELSMIFWSVDMAQIWPTIQREICWEGTSCRGKFISGETRTDQESIESFLSAPDLWSDLWDGEKPRRRGRNGKERLLRSLLLTILERSAVARATSGTWLVFGAALQWNRCRWFDVRHTSGLHKYLASFSRFPDNCLCLHYSLHHPFTVKHLGTAANQLSLPGSCSAWAAGCRLACASSQSGQ